jgi:hypothetical protein
MAENKIELKSVGDLLRLRMNFYIPSYQRGYRWTEQQVKDLLDDIDEFVNQQKDAFYCLQPLVVKGIPNESAANNIRKEVSSNTSDDKKLLEFVKNETQIAKWEVIDGQQRLTTIYILLSYLGEKEPYNLGYETRSDSSNFLNKISDKEESNTDNIDFFYMRRAYTTIKNWFEGYIDKENKEVPAVFTGDKKYFLSKLKDSVKFIWYESIGEDPIAVFTRLNIGKISLTNAELIKVLFLNRSNFAEKEYQHIHLKQQEIASEWDKIEYTLQNDEFWLFLNQVGYDKPTRIDMIFDLICEQDSLNTGNTNIGSDQYKTFRYFYQYFKSESASIKSCWSKVKEIFQTFEEWYNDLELYHYVGYLVDQVDQGDKVQGLLKLWESSSSKQVFTEELKKKIIRKLGNCNDLNKEYETQGNPKTQCKPLLLLHNIQTVINQNKNYANKDSYKLQAFYMFPFHLYKLEKWDVEHINSNSTNELTDIKEQKEWLKDMLLDISDDKNYKDILQRINAFIQQDKTDDFSNIREELEKAVTAPDSLQEDNEKRNEKNLVWNYCLLDASTNRSYGNAIFSAKRRTIIGKDQGKVFSVKDDLSTSEANGAIAFIPPCTKNVFLKYYNPATNILRAWTKADAEAYRRNIYNTLKEFGVTLNDEKETTNEQ